MAKRNITLPDINEGDLISSFKKQTQVKPDIKEPEEPEEPEKNQPKTEVREPSGSGRKKKQSYEDTFLKPKELKSRKCVYISKEIHSLISRFLTVMDSNQITVGSYIDNILSEHFDSHQNEINELFRNNQPNELFGNKK